MTNLKIIAASILDCLSLIKYLSSIFAVGSSTGHLKKYVPSLFTLCNLACGSLAIFWGDLGSGSVLLILAMLCDAFDGATARAFDAQSELGKELDSLCDLVSFGVAPAYLYYQLAPSPAGLYLISPIVLILASALRLAKFNISAPASYFTGMPTPATALFIVGVLIAETYDSTLVNGLLQFPAVYIGIPVILAFMMLSPLRMFSLKGLTKGLGENKVQFLLILFFCSVIVLDFRLAIPATIIFYILLSILQTISYHK